MKRKRHILLSILTMLLSGCTPLSSSEVINNSSNNSSETTSESSSEKETVYTYSVDDDFSWQEYKYDEESYDIPYYVPNVNPYATIVTNEQKQAFYDSNYKRATSYEDAMFRTEQGLISGDVTDTPSTASYDLNHLPNRTYRDLASYRINEGVYEYLPGGEFKSYTINNLNGKVKKVYYGAAYVSLDDVAAYLFAFGEAPANQMMSKNSNAMRQAISLYGKYGRVNNGYYSSDVTSYLYEPALPHTDNGGIVKEDMYKYREMDFGYTYTPWGYGIESDDPYNDGTKIVRSTVRFVYTAFNQDGNEGAKYIPVEHRHVFLTVNHYNDFFEYLNYEGGWSESFGWMSGGNEYCAGMSASKYGKGYYDFDNPFPKKEYTFPEVKTLSELATLFNNL